MMRPAYWAGVADSDGSFVITRANRHRKVTNYDVSFQLTWTHNELSEDAIQELTYHYGGSYCRIKPRAEWSSYKNQKPYIKYCLTGKKLVRFIVHILPYLKLKEKQARHILELLALIQPPGTKGRAPELTIKFEALHAAVKFLNHKGKPERISI